MAAAVHEKDPLVRDQEIDPHRTGTLDCFLGGDMRGTNPGDRLVGTAVQQAVNRIRHVQLRCGQVLDDVPVEKYCHGFCFLSVVEISRVRNPCQGFHSTAGVQYVLLYRSVKR
jgi:DNA-directed RNA polymerase subunit N (RpoN/RPB10)